MATNLLESIKRGLKEVDGHQKGFVQLPTTTARIVVPNVRAIREKTGLTQEQFARLFGWSTDCVSSWEQGRRTPDHSARVLMMLIDRDPDFVIGTIKPVRKASGRRAAR